MTGENGGTRTLTTSDVEITSATTFTVTLNDADKTGLASLLNKAGTASNDNTTYNLNAAEDWAAGAAAAVNVVDATGNGITVTLNSAPTSADTTKSVSYNSSYTFQANDFAFTDTDSGDSLQGITIKTLPTDGDLYLNGSAVTTTDTSVTLAELNGGKLTFTPDSGGTGTGYASFTFTVHDGSDSSATPDTVTLDVGPRPAPPAPETETETEIEQVDGVTVEKETSTENGKTVSTVIIEPVSSDRNDTDDSSTLADIPLHSNDEGEAVTTLRLPDGIGATAYDNTTARENNSIADLISMINGVASVREADAMTAGGRSFLSQLVSDRSNLWTNEVILTTNSDTPPAEPITIQGTSETGSGYKEALVIDASSLPAGTMLDLKDVEFAVIVGPASLTGGEGANIVYAGGGSQHIVLGEDDDELHGGEGDDTVGSKGGDDLIFGDAGNDTVFGGAGKDQLHGGLDNDIATFDGNRADYEVVQVNAVITVTNKADSTDVDTLINVEQIQFADQIDTIHYDSELEAVATLYGKVLDRQADLGGFQWWASELDNGLTLGGATVNILRSAEAEQQIGAAFDSLSNEEQIEAFYTQVLGRVSDVDGKAYWLNALNNGVSLEQIAEGFVSSVELTGQYLEADAWSFLV